MSNIGVVYLARGADPNWQARIARFAESYMKHPAHCDHHNYVIYKQFASKDDLIWAKATLAPLEPTAIEDYIDFNSYAGGSFLEASRHVEEPLICFLGSTSEIMHDSWLSKLYEGLRTPGTALVCCTGSSGFIREFFPQLTYPNYHIRNLSFMIGKDLFQSLASPIDWTEKPGHKIADLEFEHGPNSLTAQVRKMGKGVLVVEADRVRPPEEWGDTTYRGNLQNVLVHDRGARDYQDL